MEQLEILKRKGNKEKYDGSKIVLAVKMAMKSIGEDIEDEIIDAIENDIENEILNSDELWTVEMISDSVEQHLMSYVHLDKKYYRIAKAYVLHRNKRADIRENETEYKLLSKEFLSKYKHIDAPLTELGNFVYYRTYARWLPKEKRREYWWETVARAVDFNCSLQKSTTRQEAETLYDNIYNLRQFLSGRTMWSGGIETSYTNPISQFNCSFAVIDNFDVYKDICYLLMLGVGVGFSVERQYVNQLPKVRGDVMLTHNYYTPVKNKKLKKEHTEFNIIGGDTLEIIVGDSKLGWANALDLFLKVMYTIDFKNITNILVTYNNVREKGEPLKTFGGTASGHEALKTIIEKVYNVIMKDNQSYKKLRPVEAMDIANIIAEGIVVGGVRRSAEMCVFDSDDTEVMEAKARLYYQENGEWVVNREILHRQMSNNSVAYYHKPSIEELYKRFDVIRTSAEGNFYNLEAARKRKHNAKGTNPCLTGDMKLLTTNGYKPIGELENQNISMINKDGTLTNGSVWKTGSKPTVELNMSNVKTIRCTEDHKFMLIDSSECEAKNLKNKRIMPYLKHNEDFDIEYVKYGFLQGDGNLGRLDSDAHLGLEVNIGRNDEDIADLFGINYNQSRRKYYISGYNDILRSLRFSPQPLPTRDFPLSFNSWDKKKQISFIKGCYSANGSVLSNGRITYKTTNVNFANKLYEWLIDNGFNPYITINKSKEILFENGTYLCKKSYDININQYMDRVKFYNEVGFVHNYKMEKLKTLLIEKSPKITSVKYTGNIEDVYDFNEPLTHWGVVEGFITHNCGEILLDSHEFCNLTTLNVLAFVTNGILDEKALLDAQALSARAGYRVATMELELPLWNNTQARDRLLGCSFTGWQDMVNATDMSIEDQISLLKKMREVANKTAVEYADELGLNHSELVTTIKPEGTLSQLPTVSSGMHFSHSPYYIRRVRITATDPLIKVCEELGYPIFPEVGQDIETCSTKVVEFPVKAPNGKTKYDVSAIEQLEIYKMVMENYVDHNASNTIHVRPNEWDEVIQWIYDNWDTIIGITFISLDDSFYQLLPYEAITEEEYNQRKSKMKKFNPELLQKYEVREEEHDLDNSDCVNGVCPVR